MGVLGPATENMLGNRKPFVSKLCTAAATIASGYSTDRARRNRKSGADHCWRCAAIFRGSQAIMRCGAAGLRWHHWPSPLQALLHRQCSRQSPELRGDSPSGRSSQGRPTLFQAALRFESTMAIMSPIADGLGATVIPAALRISTFSCALSPKAETMAPAWPILRPLGAERPAM